MKVVVAGCGVIGLSSAIRLLEAGYEVQIWAKDLPPYTTSNIAAAIWYPYKINPEKKVTSWCKLSYEVFRELTTVASAGVAMRTGFEMFEEMQPEPGWRDFVENYRLAQLHELPSSYVFGYFFDAPMIHTPTYLNYLQNRFVNEGGRIVQHELQSLDEAFDPDVQIVVNCTGLGSRALLGDQSVYPIRGQIVRVAPLGTSNFYSAENRSGTASYLIPRFDDCILGGTAQVENWTLEPDLPTADAIREKCAEFVPAANQVTVLEHLVGLRPGRPEVRLEAEARPDGRLLIHNYGHGRAGVTASWGCAAEVVDLVTSAKHLPPTQD